MPTVSVSAFVIKSPLYHPRMNVANAYRVANSLNRIGQRKNKTIGNRDNAWEGTRRWEQAHHDNGWRARWAQKVRIGDVG